MSDTWSDTLRAVEAVAAQIELGGLLRGVLSSGVLARCGRPATVEELAEIAGVRPEVAARVVDALRSCGIMNDAGGGGVELSDSYAGLLVDGVGQRCVDRLAAAAARADLLSRVCDETFPDFWTSDGATRLALATGVTVDPRTEFARDRIMAAVRAVPEWDGAFSRGGRLLELGRAGFWSRCTHRRRPGPVSPSPLVVPSILCCMRAGRSHSTPPRGSPMKSRPPGSLTSRPIPRRRP